MDKTKAKLAAFFEKDDEDSSFPQKPSEDTKASQYAPGRVRKSRRDKELEAAEAKKREEEEHAARAYAEFLETFEGEDVSKKKTGSMFIKSSADGSRVAYNPGKVPDKPSRLDELVRSPSPPPAAPKPKGKRAMDVFLEEIKREQAEREARYSRQAHGHGKSVTAMAAYEGQSGSKDRGDPQTSNLFVANLPSTVTEQSLGQFFARCGPVGSVKVMWPRGDGTSGPGSDMTASRRNRNAGLSGFVSFMKRKDAERALREFDGYDWGGSVLRVGWSKAVPLAAKPMFVAPSSGKDSFSRSPSPSPARDRRRSRSRDRFRSRRSRSSSYHSRSPSRSRRRSYSRPRRRYSRSRSRRRHSRSPNPTEEAEIVTDTFIRAVAAEVKGHGKKFETALKERERNNPKYSFMLKKDHRRHAFYRGLIESQRNLDPEFDDEGYNSVYSTDSAEESERERVPKTRLGKLARKRLEAMLRSLSGKRGEIARCMTFCLEHAEAAHEVADIVITSLLVDGTAVPRKVARLHLICDILHNSAAPVPSAWKFRQEFQSRLGIVFDHLSNIYHSFPGRITADTFKKQITAVVGIWEDWIVFSPDFTSELRARLDGATVEIEKGADDATSAHLKGTDSFASRFKPSAFQLATEPAKLESSTADGGVDEVPMEMDSDTERPTGDDVDGVPADDDFDGALFDDLDGEPVDDVDGVLVDDVDGVPVGYDVDGVPIDDIDGIPVDP